MYKSTLAKPNCVGLSRYLSIYTNTYTSTYIYIHTDRHVYV